MTQRERFEAWAKGRGLDTGQTGRGEYKAIGTSWAWQAYQAACPDGWQAVPVIWPAGMATRLAEDIGSADALCVLAHHKCMLAAAPKPEDACKSPD
ncbi:MAG: hypothetical protein CME80_08195 [Halomonas sp.]|nr:hypothetical protein [Halomonas sp.]MBF57683.1 hypothetical protein [Halomonas sp.]|tara:strand:- start:2426 stop:2713 length:288 start_codon:yes stop_codon:yes gene_type:complete